MGVLLLLFIVVPAVELALLIEVGNHIGTLPTLGLIAFTGVLGASLARRQGLSVLARVRREVAEGGVPAGPVVDGVLILVAGAVLMTPGLLTDALGFALLIPQVRGLIKEHLRKRFAATATLSGVPAPWVEQMPRSGPRDVNPRPPTE
jgi:UPF0716 protein FxsA